MPDERRNDIGGKVLTAVISGLVGVLLAITWYTAKDAMCATVTLGKQVAVLETDSRYFKDLINELKTDVKDIKKAVTGQR